ncbi:MAG: bacillithiol biosynthesis cysteine-adding enzyme BshC [Crocinitomix sp. MedPE-SWsnd]|nr:MAG: bacillithiol biosynthesis cysteine-adding enzyme BshC [Crocinitomix sp. MedPE-SWsnd]
MLKSSYTFDELKMSSKLIRDLINEDAQTSQFIEDFFSFDNLKKQIEKKELSFETREVLVDQLKIQNSTLKLSQAASANINSLLHDNTYTITTGHQLNLLSGPLYSVYKVVQVIQIVERLKKENPDQNFVPVFWMATEDHDFEEINHINLFNQKVEWLKEGQVDAIAGRIKTDSIDSFLNPIAEKFQNPESAEIVSSFLKMYSETSNLQEATRILMNSLFEDYGLVIIDGDDAKLKGLFSEIAIKEIEERFVYDKVNVSNEDLKGLDYHQQVYVRECNLFYIDKNNVRHRIKEDGEDYSVAGKKMKASEVVSLIKEEPQSISPNALMRPMYQECILPNLAYVGGGGEIAYWLQLKNSFQAANLTFPLLRVRDSVLLVRQNQLDLLDELKVELLDLKLGVDQIIKDMALEESGDDLDIAPIVFQITAAKNDLLRQANAISKGLDGMIEAEFSKFSKSLDKIEAKMIKAEKGKFEKTQKQVQKIASSFFPNGGFQERYENVLPYLVQDSSFVSKIMANFSADNKAQIRIIKL